MKIIEGYKKIKNNKYAFFVVNFSFFFILLVLLYKNFKFLGVGEYSWIEIFNDIPSFVFGAVLYAFVKQIQNWGRFNKNDKI